MELEHLFGPVPSRRLGASLGIDLIPYKTCTFDCIYCECGATTDFPLERKEFVPTAEVIEELDKFLETEPDIDYITFSGSGEPTLHSGIGKIVDFLKEEYPEYQIALLTNGAFFTQQQLIDEVKEIDLIVPSLDAASEDIYQKINRPCADLSFDEIVEGIINLSNQYQGELWLEIFIISGVNDSREQIESFNEIISQINPERIQLNTLDRPGAESWVKPASKESLERIAAALTEEVEIVADFEPRREVDSIDQELRDRIASAFQEEDYSSQELMQQLGIGANEVGKYIQSLLENNIIEVKDDQDQVIYTITDQAAE
ncbi:MAG: radical SAM protein [Bacillota bacterium]